MMFSLSLGAIFLAACALLVSTVRYILTRRRNMIRRRLGTPMDARELSRREGELVTLLGTLGGGEFVTRFGPGIAEIRDVHPDAESARPNGPHVVSGGEIVPLDGDVQVILGSREEHTREENGERASLRRASPGLEVLVRGRVVRHERGSYRDGVGQYAISSAPDAGWVQRPVTIAVVHRDRVSPVLGALSASLLVGFLAMARASVRPPHPTRSYADEPTCSEVIRTLLDGGRIFDAASVADTCNDPRARAEALWAVGRIDEAGSFFSKARTSAPSSPVTLSEVEAVLVSQPPAAADQIVREALDAWYKGPSDASRRMLECLGTSRRQSAWEACAPEVNVELRSWPLGFHNPVGAVTDTARFALELPLRTDPSGRQWPFDARYNSHYADDGAAPASLALMAAVAADAPRTQAELAAMDRLLETTERTTPQAFAVAAVAAWLIHDERRLAKYIAHAEPHAGDTLRQHVAMAADPTLAPKDPTDTSKWSALDLRLLSLADTEDPEQLVGRLRDLRYTQPLRLNVLLAGRPRLHAAAKRWVEGEFVPACRGCGLGELLERTAQRREAARIVGARELEEHLAAATRRMGDVWLREETRRALWSLELLYRRP